MRLHYEDTGAGSPVVVLHGFTGSASAMSELAEALATRHRVIAIDLIGHGASPAPASAEEASMAAAVAALDGVLDRAGLDSAHILGYSLGGRVALSFAAGRPVRVRSLLAIGASAGIADPAERARRRAADADLADRIKVEGISWFVDHWMAQPILRPGSRRGRAALAAGRRSRMGNDPEALALVLRGLGPGTMPPLHDAVAALRMPVALVAGRHDAKYRAVAADLAGRLPDAEIFVVPEAGHAAHLDNPSAVADLAIRFFAAVDGRAAEEASPRHDEMRREETSSMPVAGRQPRRGPGNKIK